MRDRRVAMTAYVTVLKDRYGFSAVFVNPADRTLDEQSESFDTYEGAADDGSKWAETLGVDFRATS